MSTYFCGVLFGGDGGINDLYINLVTHFQVHLLVILELFSFWIPAYLQVCIK